MAKTHVLASFKISYHNDANYQRHLKIIKYGIRFDTKLNIIIIHLSLKNFVLKIHVLVY